MSTTAMIISARLMRQTLAQKAAVPSVHARQTHPCATRARGIVREAGRYYEWAVAAAAATFFAALAAFAAVDALRRLLVFGGVAGGFPVGPGVLLPGTNSLGPWSVQCTRVRSRAHG